MITFENVWFWQEDRPILNGVNFSIRSGERVAILGPSGVGKTTILKLILGLSLPDSGHIFIGDKDIAQLSEDSLNKVRLQFSIVFQDGALFDSLSVKENVGFYFKEYTKLEINQIDDRVDGLLKTVELEDAAEMMPEQLSGGMKRRVAIARSLAVSEAEMHLYDEPTSALDPINAEIIRSLITKLATTGKGFIVVTHEIFDAIYLATRFMFLLDGKVVYDGNKEGFLNSSEPQIKDFLYPYQRFLTDHKDGL